MKFNKNLLWTLAVTVSILVMVIATSLYMGKNKKQNKKHINSTYEVSDDYEQEGEVTYDENNNALIDVLIKTSEFTDVYHDRFEAVCNSDMIICYGKKQKLIKSGKKISITTSSNYFKKGQVIICPIDEYGRITLLSVKRQGESRDYRGVFKLNSTREGLLVVNELPLEEYLYAVVSSEIPQSFGKEALSAQAVCARTYAYAHILKSACKKYGADVDDSVSYQVYNNFPETDVSVSAVDKTKGMVMYKSGSDTLVDAYFYSTSCGMRESKKSLAKENDFRAFLKTKRGCEKDFSLFRWRVEIGADDLSDIVAGTYPSVGRVLNITVKDRREDGRVERIEIKGSDGNVTLQDQYNIRMLFDITGCELTDNSGNKLNTMKSLPSGYFQIDKVSEGNGDYFVFYGGGYGHGDGLSQNGAGALAEKGKKYTDILKYYYGNVDIGSIY